MPTQKDIDTLKRAAKRLRKERGIKHHQALDIVARAKGFASWTELVREVEHGSAFSKTPH